ncbi:hypothetical protein K474DRAFT_1602620 [Panus rudis PR-1116 ss-1]|nr:hypothetical protein K474DRAFT_1602620 [Panus rudis PR-1116 ss-1]
MPNTLEDWKRVPTTSAVIFGVELPYRPPKNSLGAFLWRKRIWIESTMGLSVLEPWEKILVLVVFYLTLTLVITGLYKLVPQQTVQLQKRLLYYFLGEESLDETTSVTRVVAGWVGRNASREL